MQNNVPVRVKDVPEQLEILSSAIQDLEESVGALEEELMPVWRSDMKEEIGDEPPLPQLAPLAELIRDRVARINGIAQRIRNLRRGLQV